MPTSVQQSFFGVPPHRDLSLSVFHDESGTDQAHDRFQLHGALFVPTARIPDVSSALTALRGGFTGRLHFSRLKDHPGDPKPPIVAKWLHAYFSELTDLCPYKCMLVDTASAALDRSRYPLPSDIYNYAAAIAIFGGIVWSYKDYGRLELQIYSEKADRAADDRFVDLVPRDVARRAANKAHYRGGGAPTIMMPVRSVALVPGGLSLLPKELLPQWELIQLTDLLTSSVRQAVVASSSLEVKLQFAEILGDYIGDAQLPPWLQRRDIYRRFSVSCFPNSRGDFFDIELAVARLNQPGLFSS